MRPQEVMRETEAVVKRGMYCIGSKSEGQVKVNIGMPASITRARMVSAGQEKLNSRDVRTKNLKPKEPLRAVQIAVVGMDTLDAAHREHLTACHSHRVPEYGLSRDAAPEQQPRVMILDFASSSVPGGGARGNQVGTQEESLCRRSSLLLGLEALSYPIPHGGCAVCPHVVVFRHAECRNYAFFDPRKNENPFPVAVVASAMPNMEGLSEAETERARAAKIDVVLREFRQATEQGGMQSLVLGAWGCGAFGNDGYQVARVFRKCIDREFYVVSCSGAGDSMETDRRGGGSFEKPLRIVFAVYGKKNLAAFEAAFAT